MESQTTNPLKLQSFGIVLVSGVGLKPDKVMETFGMVLGEMA